MSRHLLRPALRHALRAAAPRVAEATPWWLAGDIDPASVVAVYQPAIAANQVASLLDVSGNGNHATGTPTWVAGDGWNAGVATTPAFLTSDGQWSAAIRYKGKSPSSDLYMVNGGGLVIRDRAAFARYYLTHNPSDTFQYIQLGAASAARVTVVAYDRGYLDGALVATTVATSLTAGASVAITGENEYAGYGLMYAAFYNAAAALTPEQVAALSTALAAL